MSLRWLKAVTILMIRLMQALSYQHLIQVELAQTMVELVRMMMAVPAQTTAVKILAAELEQQTAAEQVAPLVLLALLVLRVLRVLQARLVLLVPNRPQTLKRRPTGRLFFAIDIRQAFNKSL